MPVRASAARRAIPLPPRKLLAMLAAAAALDGLTGLVVLSAGNSYLLRTLGASATLPAVALSLQAGMKITASPMAGWAADRRHLSTVLPAVPLLTVVGLAVMLATGNVTGYLAGLAMLSAGISTAWVLLRHLIGDATTEGERGNAATWISLASGGGVASGFGAGALIAGVAPRAAFALAIALAAAATLLLDRVRRSAAPPRPDYLPPPAASASAAANPVQSFTLGLVAAGQFALAGGLLVTFWPFVLRDLQVEAARVLWLLIPAGVIAMGALVAVGRWSRPDRRIAEVKVLYTAVAGGCLFAAGTHSAWAFAIAMAAVIPALVSAIPVVTAVVIDFSRTRTGPAGALGWLGSAEAAGSLAGSALTGAVIAGAGPRGAFIALAAIAATLVTASAVSVRSARPQLAEQPTP